MSAHIERREFITLLGGAAAAWPLAARAQQAAIPVIGFLHPGSQGAFGHLVEGFRRGLAESDFLEGRNVAVEYRWAEGQLDRLPSLAADLVGRDAAVIVGGGPAAQAAKNAAPSTTPIVFLAVEDPVKLGWVQSLNRPGGDMTGIYIFATQLARRGPSTHEAPRVHHAPRRRSSRVAARGAGAAAGSAGRRLGQRSVGRCLGAPRRCPAMSTKALGQPGALVH
jgi:ABC transporter substrate binding protein